MTDKESFALDDGRIFMKYLPRTETELIQTLCLGVIAIKFICTEEAFSSSNIAVLCCLWSVKGVAYGKTIYHKHII